MAVSEFNLDDLKAVLRAMRNMHKGDAWWLSTAAASEIDPCCIPGTCCGDSRKIAAHSAGVGEITADHVGLIPLEVVDNVLTPLGAGFNRGRTEVMTDSAQPWFFARLQQVEIAVNSIEKETSNRLNTLLEQPSITFEDVCAVNLLDLRPARSPIDLVEGLLEAALSNRAAQAEDPDPTKRIPINPFAGKCPPGCQEHEHKDQTQTESEQESEPEEQPGEGEGQRGLSPSLAKMVSEMEGASEKAEGKDGKPEKQEKSSEPKESFARVSPADAGLRTKPLLVAGGRTRDVEKWEEQIRNANPATIARATAALSKVMRQMQVGNGLQPSPRISPEKLIREKVARRLNLTRARRDEIMRKPVLVMVDTSGSCSSVAHATMLAGGALMMRGEDILLLEHSNGAPTCLYGTHEVVTRARKAGFSPDPTGRSKEVSTASRIRLYDKVRSVPTNSAYGVSALLSAYNGFIEKPNKKADLAGILAFGDFDALFTYGWLADLYDVVVLNQQSPISGAGYRASHTSLRKGVQRVRGDLRQFLCDSMGWVAGKEGIPISRDLMKDTGCTMFNRPLLGYYENVSNLETCAIALEDQAKLMRNATRRTWNTWLAEGGV